jgi:Na+/proline symporter
MHRRRVLLLICCIAVICSAQTKDATDETFVLSEKWGWGIVFGVGFGVSVSTILLIRFDRKVYKTKSTAETIYSAGRDNTSGLTASVLVSQWTWTATLLESSNAAWKYGIGGPFWYAVGASIQIMLFAIVAIEIKRKAPNMHTVTEFMLVRHGRFVHIVFLSFALLSNVLVSSMLILGGASTINDLTGLTPAVCMTVIPFSMFIYTTTGGLKATFFASYLNTMLIFVCVLYFVFAIYFSSSQIGSPLNMYQLLVNSSRLHDGEDNNTYPPKLAGTRTVNGLHFLDGNEDRSYVTLASSGAIIYGIINVLSNTGTAITDQSYWQSAIAASNTAAVPGFLLAGIAWFPIPFALSTSIGLACRALQLGITEDQANNGLVAAFAVTEMFGKSGSVLLLTILFMATTTTGSAELISASSLLTYDFFMQYFPAGKKLKEQLVLTSKHAWDEANNYAPYPDSLKERHAQLQVRLLLISRTIIALFATGMGLFAFTLQQSGVSLSWMYLSVGIWLGPAVFPLLISFFSANANGFFCGLGCILGLVFGLSCWIMFARWHPNYNGVSIDSLGDSQSLLSANLVSIGVGGFVSIMGSRYFPVAFRWQISIEGIKRYDGASHTLEEDESIAYLNGQARMSRIQGSVWTVVFITTPMVMFLIRYVFTELSFTNWVLLSAVWAAAGAYITILLPIGQELKKYYIRNALAKAPVTNEEDMPFFMRSAEAN